MKNNRLIRGIMTFAGLLLLVFLITFMFNGGNNAKKDIKYAEFLQMVEKGEVQEISLQSERILVLAKDTKLREKDFPRRYDFATTMVSVDSFNQDMRSIHAQLLSKPVDQVSTADYGFTINYQPPARENWFLTQLLPYLLLAVVFGGMLFFFFRQVQSTNNKAMNFGKTRARLADPDKRRITFNDVAGVDEEKEELVELVDFLKSPARFTDMGARVPKGVLLVGPPGTGKTLMAKAVAGEANVPFFTISGSDFVEMYVGVGASRVRDLFEQAKRNAPCIIFIDEIDAVGRHRGSGLGGGHDEREQTLNQLLVEMDGFAKNEGIIILAATNRADILDPALLRPGRFDRQIVVSFPDVKGREAILHIHARSKPLADDVSLETIAKMTPFFTGADLENVLNEAAILATRRNQTKILIQDIKEAINRVSMGPEKKSRKVTTKDKNLVAHHEAGHALLAHLLPHCDPVNEVSIIPRGLAGGYTQTLPEEETGFISRAKLTDDIVMTLGGFVTELIHFGDVSTGSSSDLRHASGIARRMVTEWGMSDEVGPMYLAGERELVIGRELGHTRNYSDQLSSQIDKEVHAILDTARTLAYNTINSNKAKLARVVEALLEKEKLTGDEFRAVLAETDDAPTPA